MGGVAPPPTATLLFASESLVASPAPGNTFFHVFSEKLSSLLVRERRASGILVLHLLLMDPAAVEAIVAPRARDQVVETIEPVDDEGHNWALVISAARKENTGAPHEDHRPRDKPAKHPAAQRII